MGKFCKNHRGFTLVELIVSTAILGIVTVAAASFMIAGSRTYSRLNYTIRLQYEAQLAMAQLQEYTIDCTDGIAWDDTSNTLYIVSVDPDDPDESMAHVFTYDGTDSIYYGSGTALLPTGFSVTAADLMAEHVTGMDVAFEGKKVNITLEMARNGKTYSATQSIALRNAPVTVAGAWSDLWDAMHA